MFLRVGVTKSCKLQYKMLAGSAPGSPHNPMNQHSMISTRWIPCFLIGALANPSPAHANQALKLPQSRRTLDMVAALTDIRHIISKDIEPKGPRTSNAPPESPTHPYCNNTWSRFRATYEALNEPADNSTTFDKHILSIKRRNSATPSEPPHLRRGPSIIPRKPYYNKCTSRLAKGSLFASCSVQARLLLMNLCLRKNHFVSKMCKLSSGFRVSPDSFVILPDDKSTLRFFLNLTLCITLFVYST